MAHSKNERFSERFFDESKSTFIFVVLGIVTLGFVYWYWILSMVKKLNKFGANIPTYLPLIAITLSYIDIFMYHNTVGRPIHSIENVIMSFSFSFVSFIIQIYISFKCRTQLEKLLRSVNMPFKMSGVWTFLFPGFYQYYIIHNIEEIYAR